MNRSGVTNRRRRTAFDRRESAPDPEPWRPRAAGRGPGVGDPGQRRGEGDGGAQVDVVVTVDVGRRAAEGVVEGGELVVDRGVDHPAHPGVVAVAGDAAAEVRDQPGLALADRHRDAGAVVAEREVEVEPHRQAALGRERCRARGVLHHRHRCRRADRAGGEHLKGRVGDVGAEPEVVGVDDQEPAAGAHGR